MIIYLQSTIFTFMEAMCCHIFFAIFLSKKQTFNFWKIIGLFFLLLSGFFGISLLPGNWYLVKAFISILFIAVIMPIRYHASINQAIFLSIGYYGLIICIDGIMLTSIQNICIPKNPDFWASPTRSTISILLCKTMLFLCILFLERKLKKTGGFHLLSNKEWLRFLLFPAITIFCMIAFVSENGQNAKIPLIVSFSLSLLNFFVFYLIQDIVAREQKMLEMRLSKERSLHQEEMHQYMEKVYHEQQEKVHEFKNHINCIQGLLEQGSHLEATAYIKKINKNWLEEMDYINTNHPFINSIINQKLKLAKSKGISMVLSINDQKGLVIDAEDIVIILSNLLDNAIEACEKTDMEQRLIKVKLHTEFNRITISVRNPTAEAPIKNGEKFETTKSDKKEHGIGLTNVEQTVMKYSGECISSHSKGFFTYSIVIPL